MKLDRILGGVVLLLGVASTADAADPKAEQPRTLELNQAVETMFEQSEDLKQAILVVESASLSPYRLAAAYQWQTFAESGVSRDEGPRTSPFEPDTITTVPLTVGASRFFPTGTQVEATVTASYFDAPVDLSSFPISFIQSGWRQGVTLSARHPILGTDRSQQLELQGQQVARQVTATATSVADGVEQGLAGVHRLFWSWALAEEALKTAQEGLAQAEETERIVAGKHRRGLLENRDLLLAQSAVHQVRQQLLGAEQAADGSRRALLELMGADPDAYDAIAYDLDREVVDVPASEVLQAAIASNLKLQTLDAQKKVADLDVQMAREQLRSRVVAIGRVSQEALFPNGAGFDDDVGYTAFAGVRYEKDFGNADAQIRLRQARIDIRRIESEVLRTKQKLEAASEGHVSSIRNARQRIADAEEMVNVAEERLQTEERNFNIGRIPLRDLIDARNQVTQSKYALAAARVSLQMAATDRDLTSGSLTTSWRKRILAQMNVKTEPTE